MCFRLDCHRRRCHPPAHAYVGTRTQKLYSSRPHSARPGSEGPIRIPRCHWLPAQVLFSTNHRPSPRRARRHDKERDRGGGGGQHSFCVSSQASHSGVVMSKMGVNAANLRPTRPYLPHRCLRTRDKRGKQNHFASTANHGSVHWFFCFCLMFPFTSKLSFISGKTRLPSYLCAKAFRPDQSDRSAVPWGDVPRDVCACHLMFNTLASHQRGKRLNSLFPVGTGLRNIKVKK